MGKDLFVTPFSQVADMAKNAWQREASPNSAENQAISAGDPIEVAKQAVLANPIVRLAQNMVVDPAIDQAKKAYQAGH